MMASEELEKRSKMAEIVIYEYEMPDGSILELEGQVGQESLADLRAKEYKEANFPKELTTAEIATDIARSIPTGAYRGIAGTLGLPGVLETGLESLVTPTPTDAQIMPQKQQPISKYFEAIRNLRSMISPLGAQSQAVRGLFGKTLPTPEAITGLVETIPGAEAITRYEPKTMPGQYLETISEFIAPGAAVTKTAKGLKQAGIIGGTSGLVQETTEQLGAPIWAQIPLTLSTALATGYLTSPSRAAQIANKALKGVSDEELSVAIELEKQLKNKFGDSYAITAPELIDNKVIQRLAIDIYGTEKGGQIMFNYLKNRPEQLKNITNKLLDEIAEKPESLRESFEKIGTTSQKALQAARNERKVTSQQSGYVISNKEFVEEDQILGLLEKIDNQINQLPDGSPAARKLKSLKTRITKAGDEEVTDTITILDDSGRPMSQEVKKKKRIPETNVNTLDLALREFRKDVDNYYLQKSIKEPTSIDSGTIFVLSNEGNTGVLDDLNAILRTNKNYEKAKNTFSKLSEQVVEPVKKNLEGLLKGDVTPAKIKSFIFNPEKNNVVDIKNTYTVLNKTDKDAFPLIARTYIESAANKAFILKEGGQSTKTGFDLYKALSGTKAQSDNFNAVLRGVAEAKGINPNDLILGWTNLNEVLKRTGRIVNLDSPGAPVSSKFLPRELAQIGSFMWRVKFAGKFDEMFQDRAIKQLANIFTKENSVEELVKLGKIGVGSNEAVRRTEYILAISDPAREATQPQEQPIAQ